MIVVNFKTYLQATGEKAVELARLCKRVGEETKVRIVAVPQLGDLKACSETGVECWAQHTDPVEPDKHTGYVTLEEVVAAGARGTLLNHSERRLTEGEIVGVINRTKAVNNFAVCVCTKDLDETVGMAKLFPTYLSYEPPELIGSRDKSVATEKPEVVKAAVNAVPVPILIGAGVHTVEDVKVGLKLGAMGVLISTGVVLAMNQEQELRDLAGAFKI